MLIEPYTLQTTHYNSLDGLKWLHYWSELESSKQLHDTHLSPFHTLLYNRLFSARKKVLWKCYWDSWSQVQKVRQTLCNGVYVPVNRKYTKTDVTRQIFILQFSVLWGLLYFENVQHTECCPAHGARSQRGHPRFRSVLVLSRCKPLAHAGCAPERTAKALSARTLLRYACS